MKRMTLYLLPALVCLQGISSAAVHAPPARPRIIDTSRVELLTVADLVARLRGADVVFVGEDHGNRAHHAVQLEVIRGLAETGTDIAIGLEMLPQGEQDALDAWVGGHLAEDRFAAIFGKNWGTEYWALYRDIFLYARRNAIPLVGLNMDGAIVREVSRSGTGSVDERKYPFAKSVRCDPDEKYRERIRRALAKHSAGQDFERFCQAQILWDSAMAWNLIRFHDSRPSRTIVVLAGSNHSWKHGIPERLRSRPALSCKVILPAGPGEPGGYEVTPEDADYVWWFETS